MTYIWIFIKLHLYIKTLFEFEKACEEKEAAFYLSMQFTVQVQL